MRNAILLGAFAFSAFAGMILNWEAVEGDYTALEIRADGAVLAVIEPEDGVFPTEYEVPEVFHVAPETCIGCRLCLASCPVQAISMNDCSKAVIDPELCINCGLCAGNCPVNAIFPFDAAKCSLYGVSENGEDVLLQDSLEED